MKKIFTLVTFLFISILGFAQAPQKMSYQAVIRDASDALVTSTTVGIQISILEGSSSGTPVYVETHTPTTNVNGLVSVEIGSGNVVTGNLATVDWSTGNYYIKSETDLNGGTNYTISGTSQLLSVPYALYAGKADGTLADGTVAGNTPYWNGTTWVTNGNNFYNNGGNIGIGTTNPTTAKLVINGGSAGQQGLDLSTHDSYANMRVIQNTNSTIDKDIYIGLNSGATSSLRLYSSNYETITVKNNMVGLNTNNPLARLDVKGNIRIEDGNQGAGKVLTSDANGIATWTTPSVGPVTSADIVDGTIVNADVSPSAAISYSKLNLTNSIQNGDLVANSVTTSKVADGTVTTEKLANSSVTTAKISAGGTPSNTTFLRGDGQWASPAVAPYYQVDSFDGTPSAAFSIGSGGAMITFMIYNNCAQGQVFGGTMLIAPSGDITIMSSANVLPSANMSATANVITLNSGCGGITMTFNVTGSSCTITTGGVTGAYTLSKFTVLPY
ncbi:hypothetical protein [Flavobacterium sp. J27]|uniref:hypothetical protein n=1 Tax=Flavobacterium sp. J27 TaxID=2060419 RepID=UPI00102FAB04|nr:hypothetical protein [Flavobacterium sp. J27]